MAVIRIKQLKRQFAGNLAALPNPADCFMKFPNYRNCAFQPFLWCLAQQQPVVPINRV